MAGQCGLEKLQACAKGLRGQGNRALSSPGNSQGQLTEALDTKTEVQLHAQSLGVIESQRGLSVICTHDPSAPLSPNPGPPATPGPGCMADR